MRAGDLIEFEVEFSEPVEFSDTSNPQFCIEVSGAERCADYVSGERTTTLRFAYTVERGDQDSDGISISGPAEAIEYPDEEIQELDTSLAALLDFDLEGLRPVTIPKEDFMQNDGVWVVGERHRRRRPDGDHHGVAGRHGLRDADRDHRQ